MLRESLRPGPDVVIGALAVSLGVALFLACPAPRLDETTPLPWDMSHHYLGALSIRTGICNASPAMLVAALRESDLYPPGHSIMLGTWMAAFGERSKSVRAFQLSSWLFLLWVLWYARSCQPARDGRPFFAAAAAALLLTTPLMALSKSLMVEVPATGLAMASLVLMGRQRFDSARAAVALAVIIAACLLTKYNIGLPLIPAGLAVGIIRLVRGERRRALLMLLATLAASAVWVAFLAWQHEGWQSFLAFARNRANAEHVSFSSRLSWYLHLYRHSFVPAPWLAWILWPLGLLGLARWRNPLALGAWVYVASALAALGQHAYLLDRNLVSISAVFIIAVGCGASALTGLLAAQRRFARLVLFGSLLLVCAAGLLRAPGLERGWCRSMYPTSSATLADLSTYVVGRFSDCHSCLVVGAFNEFSPAWLRILWNGRRPATTDQLTVDLPFPLTAGRERDDPRPDPAYAATLDDWAASSGAECAIAIEVLPGSVFSTDDYHRWNAWKRNYVDALRSSPWFMLVDSRLAAGGGVRVRIYRRLTKPLRFAQGWDPRESWGRWAVGSEAKIEVPGLPFDARLVFCTAAYEGLGAPQRCDVFLDGRPALTFEVSAPPWVWQGRQVALVRGPVSQDREVTLRFSRLWPGNSADRRLRALPFARISVESLTAPDEGCGSRP